MEIKAVKLYENGFMTQPFACGLEDGTDKFDAKIFISRIEADAMKLDGENVVRVDFTDGAYKNFDKCQKIADGIYYIFAPGHTSGNSIIIVENGDLNYLIHGDVTYTDEALYMNKLSVATEDKTSARDTLNKVREFIKNNPTVYGFDAYAAGL